MIQMGTRLEVADNSGAKEIACIQRLGAAGRRASGIGDIIRASVKVAAPGSEIKKGEVITAVIVRTRKECRRPDGSHIRFDRNSAVLIQPNGDPVGTRVFGPVARELREKNFARIISLASEVL